ncbi:hypothetical protein DSO57_1029428 [Entomophthora muscae]|uniref:Uncharacterized protein n=1 Tax=Entomophthora muscae TaxID=34485 RepID=A0ACC2RFW0_9FUNG|nr:hypothetical protein DSO57_1029428 [Entomophthora muscae]
MLLNRISQLGLLTEVDQLPHVLATFPEKVASGLVRDVTDMLLSSQWDHNDLVTQTHVDWTMQVVGHGFALPLSNAGLIESCVVIYSQWLLELHSRPALFSAGGDEQLFIQRILLSLSQVFDFRPGISAVAEEPSANSAESVGAVQRFVDLSKHVISLYASVGRALGPSMSKATWKVLLTCLLGAVDHFLGVDGMASIAASVELESLFPALQLATEVLCDPLLRSFLEVWLRSGLFDPELWHVLQKSFGHWAQRHLVVSHWNAVTLALTHGLVQRTYNNALNDEIQINTNNYNLNLVLSDDELSVLWYKFLFLLSPTTPLPDESEALALKGIARVVDQMDIASLHRPSGNTILRVVGEWLFGAKSSDARGTALAVLCYLFSRRPLSSFAEKHRERLFVSLDESLNSGQDAQPIFLHSSGLLAQPAAALAFLPRLLTTFRAVVPTLTPGFRLVAPLDQVRRGILKCTAAMLMIPSRFPNEPIPADWLPQSNIISLPYGMDVLLEDEEVTQFNGFNPYLLQTLVQFLSSETDAANFRLTLDLLTLYMAQTSPDKQEMLINGLIRAITAQVVRSSSGIHLALACFEVAGRLLEGQALEPTYRPEPAWGLVEAISTYVCRFLQEDDLQYSFQAIVASYLALSRWAEALSRTDMPLPDCVTTAFHAVCQGLAVGGNPEVADATRCQRKSSPFAQRYPGAKATSPPSSPPDLSPSTSYDMGGVQIFLAARLALAKFMTLFHRNSQTHKNTARDIPLAHEQLGAGPDSTKHAVQYFFLYPDTVMGVCESLKDRQAHVITRDPYGISCFKVSPVEDADSQLSHNRPTMISSPTAPNPTPLTGRSLEDVPSQLREKSEETTSPKTELPHNLDAVIDELVQTQVSNETFAQRQMLLHRPAHTSPSTPEISSGHRIARQLLAQLGFIQHGDCLAPLPLNSIILGTLALLDRLPTRISVPICLLYTSPGPLPTLAALHRSPSEGLPESFLSLAASLTPNQNSDPIADTRPSCASTFADFTLACPYLGTQPSLSSLGTIGQPSITVMYYDGLTTSGHAHNPDLPSNLLAVVGGPNAFLILVAPEMESRSLYRVRLAGPTHLMNQESHPWVGPLSDDVVVTQDSLSQLIKSTALSMKLNQLSYSETHNVKSPDSLPNPWLSPYLSRASILAHIGGMASHLTAAESSSPFFSTLLRPIPPQPPNTPTSPQNIPAA